MLYNLQIFETECSTVEEEECYTKYEEKCEPTYKVKFDWSIWRAQIWRKFHHFDQVSK